MIKCIADLPQPVSGVRGHWRQDFPNSSVLKDGWIGFTPRGDDINSRAQLRSTINHQIGRGYIVEYVLRTRPQPKPGGRPLTADELALHAKTAGALTAVFMLDPSESVHARALMGAQEYDDMQGRWDLEGKNLRWSVAFPIIEAWEIVGWPKARDVLGLEAARRTCEQLSVGLKPLNDDDRARLAPLKIVPIHLPADGVAARHFIDRVQQENKINGRQADALSPGDRGLLEDYSAIEGLPKAAVRRVVQRDHRLIKLVKDKGPLKCRACTYDPAERGANPRQARAILEAHHLCPMQLGERMSTIEDLVLLCPTCHREVHQELRTLVAPAVTSTQSLAA